MKHCLPSGMRGRQRGSSLFEVMIAVLVLSTGMLGVAAMQSASLRNGVSAMQRSQAIAQTYAIVDAMRANVASARAGAYNLALPSSGCSTPSAGSSLASKDLNRWRWLFIENPDSPGTPTMVGDACGGVNCAAGVCEITIRWNDEAGSGGSSSQVLRTRVRL